MLRGLSSAEAALKSSAKAETIDVRRMMCNLCCVVEMDSRFQRTVFTVKRPDVTIESGEAAGYLQGRAAMDPWIVFLLLTSDSD